MGLSECLPWKDKKKQRLLMPLLVSLLVAATDEIIQIFSPLRGPGASDVLLNFCGAAFGTACMAAFPLTIQCIGYTFGDCLNDNRKEKYEKG